MKKKIIYLFASIFLLSCSEDEPAIITPEPIIINLKYEIREITPISLEIKFVSNSVSAIGGNLIRQIWFKKAIDLEWSIKDITDLDSQRTYLLEGLERATKYIIKPVFRIENLTTEGSSQTITTLPFKYFARSYGIHRALLYSPDNSDDIDFRELDPPLSFFITYRGDSLEMEYVAISKDSILISLDSNNSLFFEESFVFIERLDLPLNFKWRDHYKNNALEQDLEIYNNKPKIDSLIIQQVRDCEGFKRTQLAFRGLFWDPLLNSQNSLNGPDDYRVKISSVQNPSVSTPIMTISEFDQNSSFSQGCKDGFRTVIDIPIQNFFHKGSVLWVAFPKDLLPNGAYEIQFSVIKNGETYSAEPFEFDLVYE